jgi:hypothetical protein
MFDSRSKNEPNSIIHPRSAPIKPDPDASAGPKGFGTTLYSMFQGDEASKQKKQLQQKAYFQELTRQINEKKDPRPVEVTQSMNFGEKHQTTSSNFANDMGRFNINEEEKKYARWQKKYEIENHSGINVNTSQVFGGVLQRDEAQLLKQKKEEQQREMQHFLMRQIEEKNRKRLEDQAYRRKTEIEELAKIEREENVEKTVGLSTENFSSPKKEENVFFPVVTESPNNKTGPVVVKEEENNELRTLSEAVQKLMKEKDELKVKISEQEKQIKDLHVKQPLRPERDSKSDLDKEHKKKPPKPRVASAQEVKLKAQHDHERAKLAVIEEKIENARKKRMEQAKLKNNTKPRRISEARVESRETLTSKPSRIKTAVFPVQKQMTLLSDSPRVPVKPHHFEEVQKEVDQERDNLDTAGKSKFIYPDSEGNFFFEDEIDKFVTNYEKRESPLVSFKSPYRNSPVIESESRFNFTTNSLCPRRDMKPLVANKAGFPSDIFRLP